MSDALTIYISRQQFGWDSNIWRGGDNIGGCTGPTLVGVMDLTHEIISENDPTWADFNGNEDL